MEQRPGRPRRYPLPHWLVLAMRPADAPFPWAAAVRGACCVAAPLAVGLWRDAMAGAVLASVGTLWAITNDQGRSHRDRAERIAVTGLAGALGLLIGTVLQRHGGEATVIAGLTAVAAVSGAISAAGTIASAAGMLLLLGTALGSGARLPGPVWHPSALLLSGTALAFGLSALPWLWRRHRTERAAVHTVYRRISELLAAIGTDDAVAARRRLTLAANDAEDLVQALVRGAGGPDGSRRRVVRAFAATLPLAEAATALLAERQPVPAELVPLPLQVGERLLDGAPIGELEPGVNGSRATQALAEAIREATRDTQHIPRIAAAAVVDRRMTGWRDRWLDHVRYAAVLSGCILIAAVAAAAMHGPKAYWLPLSVGFLLKPDLGPLIGRAVNRCLGTIGGVVIAALALGDPSEHVRILIVATVCGAVLAIGVAYHYALTTLALTPVVMILVGVEGGQSELLWRRVLDTVLAAGIVLAADFLVWPESWHARAERSVGAAIEASMRYLEAARDSGTDHTARHVLRREAYRRLSDARRAAAKSRAEPRGLGRPRRSWDRVIASTEELCDAVTALGVHSDSAGGEPDGAYEARIETALAGLENALRR